MNIFIKKIFDIEFNIKNHFILKQRIKENPLKYTRILKEKGEVYGSLYDYFKIDDNLYIESFVTENGIQKCGLYFKVERFEKR